MTSGHHGPEGVDCRTDASGLVQLLLGELRFFYSKPPVFWSAHVSNYFVFLSP